MTLSTPYDNLVQTDGGVLWTFDETSGSTANAYYGGSADSAHNGTYAAGCTVNQAPSGMPAGIANCVQFSGTTSYVTAPAGTTPNLNALLDGPLTVEAWIKCSGASTTAYGIIAGTNSNTTGAYYMRLGGADFTPNGCLEFLAANVAAWQGGGANITNNVWHHVAVMANSTANGRSNTAGTTGWTASYPTYFNIMVDGVTSVGAGSQWGAKVLVNGASGITIGSNGFAAKGDLFVGYIAKPAIYNTMLTPSKIAAHYTAGTTAVLPDLIMAPPHR